MYSSIKRDAWTEIEDDHFGRDPEKLLILPGIRPVVGETPADAEAKYQELANLVSIDNALAMLSRPFNDYDFSKHDLDAPFPDVSEQGANSNQTASLKVLRAAREESLSLRQVALRFATPRTQFVGTPEQLADTFQRWLDERGADGFVTFESLPGQLERFVEKVVPILQQRGIYRKDYDASTLRGNLGLDVPLNRYSVAKAAE